MKLAIEESVLRQALDALEIATPPYPQTLENSHYAAITALRSALDAAENVEPVAWFCEDESTLSFSKMRGCDCIPLYPAAAVPEVVEPVAWMNDNEELYFDKEDCMKYSNGFIQPLYAAPTPPTNTDSELRAAAQAVVDTKGNEPVIRRLREALK